MASQQTVNTSVAAAPAAAAAPAPVVMSAAAAAAVAAPAPAPAGPAGPASAASLGGAIGTAAPVNTSVVPAAVAAAAGAGAAMAPSADAKDASEVRCLIDNHSVGCIIGKGGANVKRVRDETGISISILKADNVKAVKERVMVVKGSTLALSKALQMVAERLVESANTSESKKQANADGKADDKETTVIRLLVHRSAVGAVIGKAGAVIKETQTETAARVQVSNDPLPQSTEKTITITGTPNSIQAALYRILNQLRDNPLKNQRVVPFVPGQQAYPQQPPYGYPQAPGAYGQQPQLPGMSPYAGGVYGAPQQPPQRQELAIPTHTAGGIIGKGGAVIRDLRTQSGTNISIADPEPNNPSERIVTVSGTAQGIQTAIFLLRQLVEQYQPPQVAPQQAQAQAQAAAAAQAAAQQQHPQHLVQPQQVLVGQYQQS